MKQQLIKILFIVLAMGVMLGMFAIGQVVAEIITMNLVMTVVYIALGCGIVYILKEV